MRDTQPGDSAPVDGHLALLEEVRVGLAERLRSEESAICRKGRGVRGLDDAVLTGVDKPLLAACIVAPEYEYQPLSLLRQRSDDRVRELLPPLPLMRAGSSPADRERGVQEQHALRGPASEIATWVGGVAHI